MPPPTAPKLAVTVLTEPPTPPPAMVAPPAPVTVLPLKPPMIFGLNAAGGFVDSSIRNARFALTLTSSALLSVVPKKVVHGEVLQPVPALPVNPQDGGPANGLCQDVPPNPFAVSTWPVVAVPDPICAVVTPPLAME